MPELRMQGGEQMNPSERREQRERLRMRFTELMAAFIVIGWNTKQLLHVLHEWKEKLA